MHEIGDILKFERRLFGTDVAQIRNGLLRQLLEICTLRTYRNHNLNPTYPDTEVKELGNEFI